MKIVKFGALALALGLFAASCNNETATETPAVDSTVMAPAPEAAPVMDSAAMAAPMADTAMKMAPAEAK